MPNTGKQSNHNIKLARLLQLMGTQLASAQHIRNPFHRAQLRKEVIRLYEQLRKYDVVISTFGLDKQTAALLVQTQTKQVRIGLEDLNQTRKLVIICWIEHELDIMRRKTNLGHLTVRVQVGQDFFEHEIAELCLIQVIDLCELPGQLELLGSV